MPSGDAPPQERPALRAKLAGDVCVGDVLGRSDNMSVRRKVAEVTQEGSVVWIRYEGWGESTLFAGDTVWAEMT